MSALAIMTTIIRTHRIYITRKVSLIPPSSRGHHGTLQIRTGRRMPLPESRGAGQVGQHQQAARIAVQAEATARSIKDLHGQHPSALAQLAEALAEAGQHQQAEGVARSITIPGRQA